MIETNRRAVVDDLISIYPRFCSDFTYKLQKDNDELHSPGFTDCFMDVKNKLIYMHIDKCASTSVTAALRTKYFFDMTYAPNYEELSKSLIEKNYTFFTVIRDPMERWISGLNEYMKRYDVSVKYVISQIKEGRYVFDEHTAPQNLFLRLCHQYDGNVKYIKLDYNLENKINDLIYSVIHERYKKNPTEENLYDIKHYKKIEISHLRNSKDYDINYKNLCRSIFDKYISIDLEHFNKLYQADYDLYNKSI
jgi:hypothetical protein